MPDSLTLEDAIRQRHSVRRYQLRPIAPSLLLELEQLLAACRAASGLSFTLVTDEPEAFGRSFLAHYGRFRGVRNYLLISRRAGDPRSKAEVDRLVGYHGERFVLEAQRMGLNTCWVALTLNKRKAREVLKEGEELRCAISVGYGEEQGVAHKQPPPLYFSADYDNAPAWFRRGIDFARLAPSAVHQQKFRFHLLSGQRVRLTSGRGFYTEIDSGIAQLHFEIGAGDAEYTII